MRVEIDIWIDDDQGNKLQMECKAVTSREEAIRQMTLAWDTVELQRAREGTSDESMVSAI